MTVSPIQGSGVAIWFADKGTDPFDSGNSSRVELAGVGNVRLRGAGKDFDLVAYFKSGGSLGYVKSRKPVEVHEITLERAVFNFDDIKDYYSGATLADRNTVEFCVGIEMTRDDGTVERIKADEAEMTNVECEAKVDGIMTGTITIKTAPDKVEFEKV